MTHSPTTRPGLRGFGWTNVSTPAASAPVAGGFTWSSSGISATLSQRWSRQRSLSERIDEPFHSIVVCLERILQQQGPLGLVIELEMHPVHGEVTPLLRSPSDECSP